MFSTKEGRVESIETVPDTENDPIKQPYYITNSHTAMNENKVQELQDVVIRFSGDSGDGMQLTGTLFSDTSALLGNGISTFPDYPAEIRAPQGTVAGVLLHQSVQNAALTQLALEILQALVVVHVAAAS